LAGLLSECKSRAIVMRYKMIYVSGGGTEYDGGIWEKKETPKTITFTQLEESFYQPNYTILKINKEKECRHCLRDWEDGTYTIYPYQCGTPYYFEPKT
jgi:hypothetical protein